MRRATGLIFVSKWQSDRERKKDGSGRVTILMITLFWFCWTRGVGNSSSERSHNRASHDGGEGLWVLPCTLSGRAGLVGQWPRPSARTCVGVGSSVHQQRLWGGAGGSGKVSSLSGRRQRPVTRTGWVRTCGEVRMGVRTPTSQTM